MCARHDAGGSEASKVGVGGDSSGGTISASVSHDVPGVAFEVYQLNNLINSVIA